jgi:hypothetical protein
MKQPPFNSNFYFAVVTVIPILYLALTLQSPTFNQLIERWRQDLDGTLARWFRLEIKGTEITVAAALFPLIGAVGAAVILASVVDEILSFLVLYNSKSNPFLDKLPWCR